MIGDPKPARRVVDAKALPFDMGPYVRRTCPLCGRQGVGLSKHHVVPRGQSGDDVSANLVWVCGDGTRGCHGVLTHRNRDGETGHDFAFVGRSLVCYVDSLPKVRAYADRAKCPGWLESYYGSLPERLAA